MSSLLLDDTPLFISRLLKLLYPYLSSVLRVGTLNSDCVYEVNISTDGLFQMEFSETIKK